MPQSELAPVALRQVHLIRGQTPVLNDVSLTVERGEIVMLLGASGSGKTSLLKLVNRLLEPTKGEVWVAGRVTTAWDAIRLRRRIGYVMQDAGLLPHYTVARNVGLLLELERRPAAERRARVAALLELVGLDPAIYAQRFPAALSGGERQRVGVARALALDPALLLMDEPFGALDPVVRARLQQEFAALARTLGKTVLFVTHDLQEALRIGTRICLLARGQLVADAVPDDFLRHDAPDVQAYVQAAGFGAPAQR